MATYQYVCEKCDHKFEVVQPMAEAALKVCPKDQCPRKPWGKGKVKRHISGGAGIIFKGSGFYITDYRSEGYKADAKKDSAASAPPKETTPAAPKPEAKVEKPKPKPSE